MTLLSLNTNHPSDLLHRIARRVSHGPVEPLDDHRFLETHRCFEASSDQQSRILDWFDTDFGPRLGPRRTLSALSIGCGSGILDLPLARILRDQAEQIRYVGVDPNRPECLMFDQTFTEADLPGVNARAVPEPIERFRTTERFDLVLIAHALYYMPDPASALEQAVTQLAPGGSLVIVHAPLRPLNPPCDLFWRRLLDRPAWFSERVAEELDRIGLEVVAHPLDAQLDATACFDEDDHWRDRDRLFDFLVQADLGHSDPRLAETVRTYFRQLARPVGDRMILPHPATIFEARPPERS